MTLTALPPYRTHASTRIPQSAAADVLAAYLAASETAPALHPNAVFGGAGVQFSAHGGQAGGLVMHNLRRVEKGLRGEWVAPTIVEEVADGGEGGGSIGDRRENRGGKRKWEAEGAEQEMGEGWQDLDDFQREQGGEEDGDMREVGNFVGELDEELDVLEADALGDGEIDVVRPRKERGEKKMDKAARKKAKKERTKAAQKEREKTRKEGS